MAANFGRTPGGSGPETTPPRSNTLSDEAAQRRTYRGHYRAPEPTAPRPSLSADDRDDLAPFLRAQDDDGVRAVEGERTGEISEAHAPDQAADWDRDGVRAHHADGSDPIAPEWEDRAALWFVRGADPFAAPGAHGRDDGNAFAAPPGPGGHHTLREPRGTRTVPSAWPPGGYRNPGRSPTIEAVTAIGAWDVDTPPDEVDRTASAGRAVYPSDHPPSVTPATHPSAAAAGQGRSAPAPFTAPASPVWIALGPKAETTDAAGPGVAPREVVGDADPGTARPASLPDAGVGFAPGQDARRARSGSAEIERSVASRDAPEQAGAPVTVAPTRDDGAAVVLPAAAGEPGGVSPDATTAAPRPPDPAAGSVPMAAIEPRAVEAAAAGPSVLTAPERFIADGSRRRGVRTSGWNRGLAIAAMLVAAVAAGASWPALKDAVLWGEAETQRSAPGPAAGAGAVEPARDASTRDSISTPEPQPEQARSAVAPLDPPRPDEAPDGGRELGGLTITPPAPNLAPPPPLEIPPRATPPSLAAADLARAVQAIAAPAASEAPRADASYRPTVPDAPRQPTLGDRTGAAAPVPEAPARAEAAATRRASRGASGAGRRRRRSGAFDANTAKAERLLMAGQVSAARLAFQSAATAGDPRGARGLARTFDERVISKLPASDVMPNRETAQHWYGIADKLEARQRARQAAEQEERR